MKISIFLFVGILFPLNSIGLENVIHAPKANSHFKEWVPTNKKEDVSSKITIGTYKKDGDMLILSPQGKALSIQTKPLLPQVFNKKNGIQIDFYVKNHGVKAFFAILAEFFDADNKRIKQYIMYATSGNCPPQNWAKKHSSFGPKTKNPIPKNAKSMHIRTAFSPQEKVCSGKIEIAGFKLSATQKDAAMKWPKDILVNSGNLQVRFESRSFWTLYRIEYKGKRIGVDNYGSHYGSVAKFKDIGFIGSGHTENDKEKIKKISVTVDGKKVTIPQAVYPQCKSFSLSKVSMVRSIQLSTVVDIADDKIVETVTVEAIKPEKLDLFYHFMHPWSPTATDYIAETTDGKIIQNTFKGDKGFKIEKPVKWSAVFDATLNTGAVIFLSELPANARFSVKYWDMPPRYRKHYLQTMNKVELKPGTKYSYRAIVVPFAATPDDWKKQVIAIVKGLKK